LYYYSLLQKILQASNPQEKIELFYDFYELYKNDKLDFSYDSEPVEFVQPSYAPICKIVAPKDVPNRKNLHESDGLATFLHAILHIEYSAIDLALDASYRFRDLPRDFYDDWLEVAEDEIRHFNMLNTLLQECGYEYGDFEVHQGLFDASCKSSDSLLKRMALIPRYMEANGLDSNYAIRKKIKSQKIDKRVLEALDIILEEEISHVSKGDRWFKYACEQSKVEPKEYFNIVNGIYPNSFKPKKGINIEARRKAGFKECELEYLQDPTRELKC
jgi:uncharacterized ferritin-like protein (DUF455 family)